MKTTILLLVVLTIVQLSRAKDNLQFVFVTAKGQDHQACNYPQGPKITSIEEPDSELTEDGKKEAYEFGQKLSSEYKSRLGVTKWDSAQNYWAIAAIEKRTKKATLITAGGLEGDQSVTSKTWSDEELQKTSFPALNDFFRFINPQHCPKYIKGILSKQNDINTILGKCEAALKIVKEHYPEVNKPQHTWLVYETFKRMKQQKASGLEWLTDDIMKQLQTCSAEITWFAATNSDEWRKISGGLLLTDIFTDLDQITQGKPQPYAPGGANNKMSLFTVPQVLVISHLAVITPPGTKIGSKDVTAQNIYPEDGAYVNLELFKGDKEDWKVKIVYVKGKGEPQQTIALPGCPEKCPYNKFKQILQQYAISDDDHKKACGFPA